MSGHITRRRAAAALFAPAPVLAQMAAPQQQDLLEKQRAEMRSSFEKMDKVELDINVQPAFVFKP